jgi:hypothetical protein
MADKWVDSSKYFGPDRRRRSGAKLWNNKRSADEAGERPALGAMIRRLRVQMMGMETADDHRLALQILSTAISESERLRCFQCADALKQADRVLRSEGPRAATAAEAHLIEAHNIAANGR